MAKKIYILLLCLFIVLPAAVGQENRFVDFSQPKEEFSIKVTVIEEGTNKEITNASVLVNAKTFLFSNTRNRYVVKAGVGDQLVVKHPDFEPVFYTVKNGEDIKVIVKGYSQKRKKLYNPLVSKERTRSKQKIEIENRYYAYLDSAKYFKTQDINKSISFITKTLEGSPTRSRRAVSFSTLADVYVYWKQYDLAEENYKASLKEVNAADVRLKLARAEFLQKKYKNSKGSYLFALKGRLSAYDQLTANEGLGDLYMETKEFDLAKNHYEKALLLARLNSVPLKITDLNSKLAEVFAEKGDTVKANSYYDNSLDLASKVNAKRSLKEQEKVADYYNKQRRFDDEIELRKNSLKDVENLDGLTYKANVLPEKGVLNDSITTQKINYQIGNAFLLKEEYQEAIPYFKKSIKDASAKKDLIVQKDATRKLSETYATVGNYTKALESYQDYVKLVDTLYIRKEQEIQQIKRFSKKIADNQNRIASLEKDKELSDSKVNLAYKDQQLTEESNKRQVYIIYSLVGGFFLMSLLAYLMFRSNRQQKLSNNLLALKSMRSQMNPHFIFNALNSVNSFIAVNDERSANRYLSEFSALMRSVLENSDEDFIPLTKEIELLELYVKLEHNRFQDKFDFSIAIDEEIPLENYSIPPMLLQPYIENAIWHGLRYKEEKGNLKISMQPKASDSILITIQDDGVGRQRSIAMKTKNQLKQKSKGMSTIKRRIAILNDMYQDKVSVKVSDLFSDGSGTKVELVLKSN